MHKIKEYFDYNFLVELGYEYCVIEAGYISKDLSTIVIAHRSPYQRQVVQYTPHLNDEYLNNIKMLKEIGAIE